MEEKVTDSASNPSTTTVTTTTAEKPYHAKRPHRKSRAGCRNCKARKVKCDEGRPVCRPCTVRGETCVYLAVPQRAPRASSSSSSASSPDREPTPSLALAGRHTGAGAVTVTQEPLFIPSGRHEIDMRLLWFYTTATYASFSTGQLKERSVDVVLKVNVVQYAFANPFLMNCILGLSAMHINHLGIKNMGISRSQEMQYRAKAFETYRQAVEAADPATYPALIATSLLLCGLSSHVFRGEDAKPFSILDWITLWRGIGVIIDVTHLPATFRTGMAALVFRPTVDLDASSRCLPNDLLFMVASIKGDDPDFPLVQTYYKTLQFLGSLYLEMRNGFSEKLFLRIVTFFTYLPEPFVEAAKEMRPRALVILAHYLAFTKFKGEACWWWDGIAEQEITSIYNLLGPEWEGLLRLPMASLLVEGNRALVRLLLDDPSWDEPTKMEAETLTSEAERDLAIRAAIADDTTPEVEAYRRSKLQIGLC